MPRRRLLVLALAVAAVDSLSACQPNVTQASAATGAASSATTGTGTGGGAASSATTGTGAGATSSATTGAGGAGAGGSGVGGVGAGGAGGDGNDVTGTLLDEYVLESSTKVIAMDLSAVTVEALRFAGGAWTAIPGHGKADGTFRIPGVPPGPFTLHVGGVYLVTSERALDLGTTVQGRPGAWPAPPGNRSIIDDLKGMVPWKHQDYVEWFVANSGGSQVTGIVGGFPQPGDTTLSAKVVWSPNPVIESSKGDTLTVIQLAVAPSTPAANVTVTRRFVSLPGVTEVTPMPTQVSGTFQDVALDRSVALDFRASKFLAHGAEVNPAALAPHASDVSLALTTLPGAAQHGFFGSSALLLNASMTTLADADLGVVHYGDPYPASWGTVGVALAYVDVPLQVPGASQPFDAYGTVEVLSDAATFGAGPIAPLVTPVLQPLVNGATAFGPLQGITTTPTLSWSPPAVGAPTHYLVTLWPMVVLDGGVPQYPFVDAGAVQTSDTSVVIPPGLMAPGMMYYFVIQAMVVPGEKPDHPYRQGIHRASADVITSVATP